MGHVKYFRQSVFPLTPLEQNICSEAEERLKRFDDAEKAEKETELLKMMLELSPRPRFQTVRGNEFDVA